MSDTQRKIANRLYETAKNSAIPFALGCAISMLSFVGRTSPFYAHRWWIACLLLIAGVLSFLYSTVRSMLDEYERNRAITEEVVGDTRQMLRAEDIERKYILQDQHTHADIRMSITNISDHPVGAIDIKLRADNGNGISPHEPDIIVKEYEVNGTIMPAPETLIVDRRIVSWNSSNRRQCEVTVRLPLSLDGALSQKKTSNVSLSVVLRNNLALWDPATVQSCDDSITFEIPIPTRRFVVVVEARPTPKSCWTRCDLSPKPEWPLGVGAYSGYGSAIDQNETARLGAPTRIRKSFRWQVDKPLLGYTYCIGYRLVHGTGISQGKRGTVGGDSMYLLQK